MGTAWRSTRVIWSPTSATTQIGKLNAEARWSNRFPPQKLLRKNWHHKKKQTQFTSCFCSFLSNKIDIQDKQNITCLHPTSNDLKHQPTDEHGYDDMGSGALKWLEIFFEKHVVLVFLVGKHYIVNIPHCIYSIYIYLGSPTTIFYGLFYEHTIFYRCLLSSKRFWWLRWAGYPTRRHILSRRYICSSRPIIFDINSFSFWGIS